LEKHVWQNTSTDAGTTIGIKRFPSNERTVANEAANFIPGRNAMKMTKSMTCLNSGCDMSL
jgi:hypothetical protein